MTTIKTVIEFVDVETNQFDTRNRADIDTAPGFTKTGDGRVTQVLIGTGKVRTYTIKYCGPSDIADQYEQALIAANTAAGMTRLPLCQS